MFVSMEKIFIRSLIVLAALAIILALVFYPSGYAVPPLMFLFICIAAEFSLHTEPKKEMKGVSKVIERIILALLGVAVLGCFIVLCFLWKFGRFLHL